MSVLVSNACRNYRLQCLPTLQRLIGAWSRCCSVWALHILPTSLQCNSLYLPGASVLWAKSCIVLARGIDRHPPVTVAPPPDRASVHRFELPVEDINTVVFAVRVVADELAAHLGAHGASCVRLHVSLQTDHGEQSERVWYQPEGLTAAAMAERVRWQMEAWVATRGVTSGVVLVRLSPVGVRAREGRQLGLWGGSSEADEWAARAVERLAALLGPHSVHVAEWKGGRDASEVFVLAPTAVIDMQRRSESVVTNEQQWSGALPTPSPSLIYAEPLPAMVVDAEIMCCV